MASDLPTNVRVLGGTEENWTRSTTGGTGIVAFGTLFKRVIDIHHVSAATQELLEKHSFLGAQIVENAKGKLCLQMGKNVPTHLVHEKPWPSVEGMDREGVILFPHDDQEHSGSLALHKLVAEELNINFVNSEGKSSPPLNIFRVHVYVNPGLHQTVIILKMHSGALDRPSGCVVAEDFLAALNASIEGRSSHKSQAREENLMPALEDMIPKGKASKGLLQKGFDAVGYAVNSKKYAMLPFQPSFTGSGKQTTLQSDVVSKSLGKQGTTSLFAACKEENTTYAAALAAAFLKTAAGLKELKEKKQDEFSYTCVMDCRSMLEPKLDECVLGNYSSGIPQNEKVKDGVPFWDFARQIGASIEKDVAKSKQFSEMAVLGMLFSQVMKHPNVTPSSSLRTALFTLFVDGPMEAEWKCGRELGIVGSLGPFSSMHFVGPCVCVGEALLTGPELLLSFIFPSPLHSRPQILQFLDSALQLLHESTLHY